MNIRDLPSLPLSPDQKKEIKELLRQTKELGRSNTTMQFPKPGMYHDVHEMMPYVSSIDLTAPEVSEEKAAIAALQKSDTTDFQAIAASQLNLTHSSYTSVRNQSDHSFSRTLISSGVGLLFFLAAVVYLIIRLGNVSYFGAAVSAVGGVLVEVYAGLIQA